MKILRTSVGLAGLAGLALVVLVACGGSSSNGGDAKPNPDDGTPINPTSCGTCSSEGACCLETVYDGFGPEGYRCTSGTWTRDVSCEPPPPPCRSPLTGSLTRADGAAVRVTCFESGPTVDIDPGGQLQLAFTRPPVAGEVVPVIPYTEVRNPDAGGGDASANAVTIRIGRPGGFSGFQVDARSVSGTVTATSLESSGEIHVTLDAQMGGGPSADPAWTGTLTGSW